MPRYAVGSVQRHGLAPVENAETRHLDGDKVNNKPENLAWGTAKENALDRERHKAERATCAAIVAWLREQVGTWPQANVEERATLKWAADAIERGDWRKR